MKVIVLGAGVVGVSAAYYLAHAGAQVEVLDRQPGVALETSFANAGQVSPGYSTPWAAPGVPLKAMRWLFERHAPLSISPDGSLFQWQWLAGLLRNCTAARYAANKSRMLALAEYSLDALQALRRDTGIHYDEGAGGTLQLFRSAAQLHQAARDVDVLQARGVPFELLDAAGVIAAEPALARADAPIAGGLRLPRDETGDCYRFTRALANRAASAGVRFRFGVDVQALARTSQGRVSHVEIGTGPQREALAADAFVVALGTGSRRLLRPLGLSIPVYPVKGYSLTLPVVDAARAPLSTVLDETYKIALTRLGDRIRVGGMAELAGFDTRLHPRRRETLELVTRQLFPGGDFARAEFWCGLRPMTPDSVPRVGRTPIDNLYLDTGHGTLGWTMACGSGRLIADLVTGRPPEIEAQFDSR